MKNKGFTLVELLVVMAIIGIVTTMSWPAINRIQEMNTMSKYESYGDAMISAAKIYVDSYEEDMFYYEDDLTETQKNNGQCYYIMLQELIEHFYIKDFNQKGMTCVSDSSFVRVTRKKGKYTYEYFLGCGNKKEVNPTTKKLPNDHIYFTLPEQNTLNVADNTTCLATISEYKLTYNSNGGSACSSTSAYYMDGDTLKWGSLCTPKREYYTFLGWYNGSQLITADTPVTGSMTVKAKWRKNQVQIIYKLNGGHLRDPHDPQFTEGDGIILRNGSEIAETANFDETMNSSGFWNYNNPDWVNIGKVGFHANTSDVWNTEPDGSGRGYNQTTRYPASELCDASQGDCLLIVYVKWIKNYAYVHQYLNGGQLTTPRHSGVTVEADGLVKYNGSANLRSIAYGESADPWDWNNPSWLNSVKTGYKGKLHEEWSQNPDGTGKTYDHHHSYTATDYCDATYNNCTANIYVNWVPE